MVISKFKFFYNLIDKSNDSYGYQVVIHQLTATNSSKYIQNTIASPRLIQIYRTWLIDLALVFFTALAKQKVKK